MGASSLTAIYGIATYAFFAHPHCMRSVFAGTWRAEVRSIASVDAASRGLDREPACCWSFSPSSTA